MIQKKANTPVMQCRCIRIVLSFLLIAHISFAGPSAIGGMLLYLGIAAGGTLIVVGGTAGLAVGEYFSYQAEMDTIENKVSAYLQNNIPGDSGMLKVYLKNGTILDRQELLVFERSSGIFVLSNAAGKCNRKYDEIALLYSGRIDKNIFANRNAFYEYNWNTSAGVDASLNALLGYIRAGYSVIPNFEFGISAYMLHFPYYPTQVYFSVIPGIDFRWYFNERSKGFYLEPAVYGYFVSQVQGTTVSTFLYPWIQARYGYKIDLFPLFFCIDVGLPFEINWQSLQLLVQPSTWIYNLTWRFEIGWHFGEKLSEQEYIKRKYK